MQFSSVIQDYNFGDWQLHVKIPDPVEVENYCNANNSASEFYWSQVWPAAIGMCEYMAERSEQFTNKKVLEIAAGLALPSLLAAKMQAIVTSTDLYASAIEWIKKNAALNELKNLESFTLDWQHIPSHITTDVLLLSDINYAQESFDALEKMILHFLHQQTTILISTPERLVAKQFIQRLAPFIKEHQSFSVIHHNTPHNVSVFCL